MGQTVTLPCGCVVTFTIRGCLPLPKPSSVDKLDWEEVMAAEF